MAKITLDEQTAPSSPGAGKGVVFVLSSTPNTLMFMDDEGTVWTLSAALSRGVSLGAAPSAFTFKVLDGGAGVPDILYFSAQLTSDSWDWVEVVRAP